MKNIYTAKLGTNITVKNNTSKKYKISIINNSMMDIKHIKDQIINDKKFANIVQYMLSKTVLENPIQNNITKYKKHKLVLNKSGLFSIHRMDGTKLFSNIKFKEVAYYCVDNIKCYSKCSYILELERELLRFRDKILFFKQLQAKQNKPHIEDKIGAMIEKYCVIKNSIDCEIKYYNQYL